MGKVNKSISDIIKQDFSRFDELYLKLSDIFLDNKKVLIAVSGGPDSMFLSVLIYNFFVKNNFNLNNLFFVHCNHKTREETDDEQKFVESFFQGLNLSISVYVDKKDDDNSSKQLKTEQALRLWRYSKFQKIIDKNKIDFLLTGHNLTDRIESSFMNMFRGSGLNGFSSMRFVDRNNLLTIDIVRPLLGYTKGEIESFCKEYGVEFVVDKTNLDEGTSLRNKIRLSLLPEFAKMSNKSDNNTNSFFDSMKQIYKEIDFMERSQEMDVGRFVEIPQSPYWNSNFAFLRDIPLGFISKDILIKVFQKFNVFNNISSDSLDDYLDFFHNAKQGHKYINGVYFFLSHEKIFIIKSKKNFWEKNIEKTVLIDKLGYVELGKNNVFVDDENLVGLKLRYPKIGDKLGSKSWSKYCINHKIPVFWRKFIPVVVDGNNIIKYFYSG